MEIFSIITLALSSLLLLFVGSSRLSNPIKTYLKSSGITLSEDVDLMNEVRGLSAVMLSAGIIIVLGTFIPEMKMTSHIVAILIFIGFAIGRITSMLADGSPNKQLKQGLIFELVLGSMNVVCLVLSLI